MTSCLCLQTVQFVDKTRLIHTRDKTMFLLFLIALIHLKGCEPCSVAVEGEDPEISLANSTHIILSWEGVFSGCSDNDVKEVYVQFQSRNYNDETTSMKLDGAKFSQKRAFFKSNPCLQHQMMVTLDLGNGRYLSSKATIYNEVKHAARYNYYKTLYAGLINKEVVQKTCLEKSTSNLTIPDPPQGLTKCILEKEVIGGSAMLGHRLKIEFKIVNPENVREIIDFEAVVDKLGFCPEENTTGEYKENNKDFAFQNNVLAVVVGLSVSILVAALVTLLILCYRKRRASKQARKQGRVDQNPVYGHSED